MRSKNKLKLGLFSVLAAIVFAGTFFSSKLLLPEQKKEISGSDYSHSSTISKEENNKQSSFSSKTNSSSEVGSEIPLTLSIIPDYSGSPYVVVNNNIPRFSEKEITAKGYEKYSELDYLGRTGVAVASLGKETMPKEREERQDISRIKPTGWVQAKYDSISGKYLYNRCHLIGWQLSAENANKRNLITGTKYFNVSGMLPFENMVADYIRETNNHVAYRVTPLYKESDSLLASGVQMEAYSVEDKGEGICFNVFCYNVQPGISIDYKTGYSKSEPQSIQENNDSKYNSPAQNSIAVNTEETVTVWIPRTGTKYHQNPNCSNMKNPTQVTKEEAENQGYDPCKKCW